MNQRVLIIDDCESIHALVRTRLAKEALDLESAHDGAGGLERAIACPPDLILLDVDLPDTDGFEICRRLKSTTATINVPVIFLTGATSTEEKIRGLELGAVDYITKPFDPAELRARVRSSLRTKYLMDLLARKAMIDGLTGLWSRSFFDRRLNEELSASRRSGQPLAVVMADVDHFKSCNDRFGHMVGDDVLRGIAAAMTSIARAEDVLCRFGGEEFAVIAPSSSSAGAFELAERLRRAISETKFTARSENFAVTASLGVAATDVTPGESLVEVADQAMYRAKNSGRNCTQSAQSTIASASISKSA